jgi:hypothetical protein
MESNVIFLAPCDPLVGDLCFASSGSEVIRIKADGKTVVVNKTYCTIEDDGDTLTIRMKTEGEA